MSDDGKAAPDKTAQPVHVTLTVEVLKKAIAAAGITDPAQLEAML